MIGYWPFGLVHGYWSLAIDIYTKKCGYVYNPFWLLSMDMFITLWLLVLAIDIYTKAIVGMVITN
jgi:hypothetical protein